MFPFFGFLLEGGKVLGYMIFDVYLHHYNKASVSKLIIFNKIRKGPE